MKPILPRVRRLVRLLPAIQRSLTPVINALTMGQLKLTAEFNELTKERNTLVGQVNELTGERNILVGEVNELTGERNTLVGQVNKLKGQHGILIGQLNLLTGERNTLVGQKNELVGQRNELTQLVNSLSHQVNLLTGERNSLTGKISDLIGEIDALKRRNNALTLQINSLGGTDANIDGLVGSTRKISGLKPIGCVPTEGAHGGQLPQAKFLIISNLRSGSTWLHTMLGALPDIATDYELKWGTSYEPSVAHFVLSESSPTVSEFLERMETDAPIAGTKFVFDPIELTWVDLLTLRDKIGRDVRIIHLTRRFRDIFLSRRRGFYHQVRESAAVNIGKHIKAAIGDADIGKAMGYVEPTAVSAISCYEELKIYLQYDIWAMLLRDEGFPYLLVDYENVADDFVEIAKFVGSTAQPEAINSVLMEPPVMKLPQVEGAALVQNLAELEPLFQYFEALRKFLLMQTGDQAQVQQRSGN
jgi:hypothetical protein